MSTPLSVRDYYDRLSTHEQRVWYPTPYSWQLNELLTIIELSGRSLLDVGCGAGNLALSAAARGASVSASDISQEAVAATRSHAKALGLALTVEQSNGIQYWITKGAKFDVVICNPPSLDLLSEINSPSVNPFLNSYLLIEVLKTYATILKRRGCLLSVVCGKDNMRFVNAFFNQANFNEANNVQPFSRYKEVLMTYSHLFDLDHLSNHGLIGWDKGQAFWNAYYFGIFHF